MLVEVNEPRDLIVATGKCVSYLRVSTQQQGRSGLGLEVQREAVAVYLSGRQWKLVEEVVEVESGKRSNCSELARALSLCRIHGARLLVAKLDRLARNMVFTSALRESGVDFEAVDLPQANNLTVHTMAAVAEYDATEISTLTRAVVAAAKARGPELGRYHWHIQMVANKGSAESARVRTESANKHARDLMPLIQAIRAEGATSLRQIASALNERKVSAVRGGEWSAVQVKRIMERG